MRIPSNTLWSQTNQGDVLGSLSNTQNVSLDTPGKVTATKKTVATITSLQDADFGYPVAIVYFDGRYITVTDQGVFEGGLNGNTLTEVATFTPSTTLASDAVVFKDSSATQLIVTTDTNFARWNGGGSVNYALGALTSGVPHPMCVMNNMLAIGNGNEVRLYTDAFVLDTTLILPVDYEVTSIRARNSFYYVATRNVNGGEASVFTWNGETSLYDYNAPVGASWVFSLTEYGSSVAAITSQGQLGLVSGNEFSELAALPVYYSPHTRWQGAGGLQLNGKVFNRGMVTIGKSIYLNIEGETDTGFLPSMKSGLWVYDPDTGLNHRATASSDALVRDGSLGRSGDTLTTSASHQLKTGDAVAFRSVSGLSGVDAGATYYATALTANTLKLSSSRDAVDAGRFVTLSGTPGASDVLVYAPNADYGSRQATSGALATTVYNETPLDFLSSEVIFGCRTYEPDGTAVYVLNAFADTYNISRLETQRIYTSNVEQSWNQVVAFIDGIKNSAESMVLKVQTTSDRSYIELSGVWLDAQTINNQDYRNLTAWSDIQEGDELVITDGQGQGRTVHVVSVSASASTVSVVVDEAIGVANLDTTFYATTFKKVSVLTADHNTADYLEDALIAKKSSWVKIAIELRGYTPAVNMLELSNEVSKGVK